MTKTVLAIAAALGIAAFTTTAEAQNRGLHVGAAGAVQGTAIDNGQWGGTVSAGYRLNRYLGVEALADFTAETETARGNQALFAVATAGFPVGPVTPYVLAGAGYGFGGLADAANDLQALWTAGVGVAYNISDRWQLDGRYRRVEAFTGDVTADRVTLGLNFRF